MYDSAFLCRVRAVGRQAVKRGAAVKSCCLSNGAAEQRNCFFVWMAMAQEINFTTSHTRHYLLPLRSDRKLPGTEITARPLEPDSAVSLRCAKGPFCPQRLKCCLLCGALGHVIFNLRGGLGHVIFRLLFAGQRPKMILNL